MFPSDANPAGNVFGGEILKHIDMVAGIVAQRYSQSNAVTVSMDSVNFLKPVFVGNVLKLNARINYVHNSSMEIEIKAEAEDIVTGIRTITGTAFVTFVALDDNRKPICMFLDYLLKQMRIEPNLKKTKLEWKNDCKIAKNSISDFYGSI